MLWLICFVASWCEIWSHTVGKMWTEVVLEQGAEVSIWT